MLLGAFMPEAWHARLPRRADAPPTKISGVRLLKICLALEGLALCVGASLLRRRIEIPEEARIPDTEPDRARGFSGELLPIALVTLLGAGLRIYKLGSDLWFDEITTVAYYREPSFLQVVATYINSNNHLLNTLLMKLSVACFGDAEWAVRLPAALFGIATIPLLYAVARLALPRRPSLAAAALLACSYHHVFYSQNARGYTAHVFFSLLSALALVKAMRGDRARWWAIFIAATVLNVAALLNSAFVAAGQALASFAAAWIVARRTRSSPWPMWTRLFIVFAIAGSLVIDLYAPVLPDVSAFMARTYAQASSGFGFWSGEIFKELARGLAAGFGPGLLLGAIPFLAVGAWGFWRFLRRLPLLAMALAAPLAVSAGYLLLKGYTFSPRFFILGLPLAILCACCALDDAAKGAARKLGDARRAPAFFAGAVALLIAASIWSLVPYYRLPKQDFGRAFSKVDSFREPDDGIIGVYLMEWGFWRYAPVFGWKKGKDYAIARSLEEFKQAEAAHPRSIVVTTFHRALKLDYPDLASEIGSNWTEVARFPGSMGDGTIVVWMKKGAGAK